MNNSADLFRDLLRDLVEGARIRLGIASVYLRHQYAASRTAPHGHALTDKHGRRMRASAYGRPAGNGSGNGVHLHRAPAWVLPSVAKMFAIVLLGGTAFVGTSKAYINFAGTLPDARLLAATQPPEDTLVYASDGTTVLADLHDRGRQHYYQAISAMGKWLPAATVAVEDANFYHEPGIDITGIARAAWIDYREHRAAQGASTITQQLVKLRLIGNQPTLTRKIKEAVLAIQVQRMYSKPKILEMYLNTVFYGNDAYGTAAAAQIYFHLPTAKLDIAQAAMLAGIPQNPSNNNPIVNWEGAKVRQREVLDAMVRHQAISQGQANQAYAEDLSPPAHMFTPQQTDLAPGFIGYVTNGLVQRFGTKSVYEGGLHVYTTLNWQLQQTAVNALRWNYGQNGVSGGFDQEAITALDPHTGAILAMDGSLPNQPGGQFNFAASYPGNITFRHPGSSMKIYTYTAAISSGKYTMVSPIQDTAVKIDMPGQAANYEPKNYDLGYHGTCLVPACMGNSLNIPAVKVELGVGIPAVVQTARDMGAPPWDESGGVWQDNQPLDYFGPSLTLGGYNESPLQMATGASVLAAGGVLHAPFGIDHVLTSDGAQVFKWDVKANAKQVLDPKVAFIMGRIMSDDSNRAMIFGRGTILTLPGRTVAAKTGTSESYRDGWTVGFTPSLASAIWVGNADYHPMNHAQDAFYVATPGWHRFMQDALDAMHKGNEWYSPPPGLIATDVGGHTVYFLPGTGPQTPVPPLPSWVHVTAPPKPPSSPSPSPSPQPPQPPGNSNH